MATNCGFLKEDEFRNYVNGKKFEDLNENFKSFVLFITKNKKIMQPIICKKGKGGQKPDVILTIDSVDYAVSLKIGCGNSVHQESLDSFIEYLKKIGVNDKGIKLLKEFHYADGTDNDTGKLQDRQSSAEYCKNNPNKIKELNSILNSDPIRDKIIERALFQGKNNSYIRAEYIYHGSIESGHWANSYEIKSSSYEGNDNTVHVGNLTYQVWGRNQDGTAVHPERRYIMQFKFGSCITVLTKIRGE